MLFAGLILASLSAVAVAQKKVIVDNDFGGSFSYPPTMVLLGAGYDVLGITVVSGDTWATQEAAHILRFLEFANISYIDVYMGATYPLINTPARSNAWQTVNGAIAFPGAFLPDNATADAMGADPGVGEPFLVTPIPEGVPTRKASNIPAVAFMIEQVHKYPGEVSIYAAGPMTNIALAVRADPFFASLCKEIVIQGGYVDTNLFQTTPTPSYSLYSNADIGSDFNFLFDPEAAKITINADFPSIVIAGQVSNSHLFTQDILDQILAVNTTVTTQLGMPYGYPEAVGTPIWDEVTAGVLAHPDIITSNVSIYMDVDIAYAGPFYGRSFVAAEGFQPAGSRMVNFVEAINFTKFIDSYFVPALQGDYSVPKY